MITVATEIIKPLLLDETGKSIDASIREIGTIIADSISGREVNENIIYGFHINSRESNPYNAVTYLEDASGMSPARMNFAANTFSYGSWKDAFFMPRPCMVRYDGTVDYYLDENDYEKKENGEVSALGDSLLDYGVKYPGNAMMEWGRYGQQIWTKVIPDIDDPTSGSVYIANKQVDSDYTCYPFINNQGYLVNHFYTAIYNGSVTAYTYNSTTYFKLRSIPRQIVINSPENGFDDYYIPWEDDSAGTPYIYLTRANTINEINLCLNNNTLLNKDVDDELTLADDRANVGWFTEVFCDIQLINNLLILIGKSLNTQDIFGNGNIDGYFMDRYQNHGILYTGSHKYDDDEMLPDYSVLNKAGLFWGTIGAINTIGAANAVKVFGMENWWGNQLRRYAGHISKSNGVTRNHFIKQTFGTDDGSTTVGYNLDGTGYIDTGISNPSSSNEYYIKFMKFSTSITNINGNFKSNILLPIETNGTSTTYWCDEFMYYDSDTRHPLHGGSSSYGFWSGAFCLFMGSKINTNDDSPSFGSTLSFKPYV